jgi:hypothetical protein
VRAEKSTLVRNCKGVFAALQHVKCFKMKKTAKVMQDVGPQSLLPRASGLAENGSCGRRSTPMTL